VKSLKHLLQLLLFLPIFSFAQNFSKDEIARWKAQAQRVTILRDNFGVPHIYGKTDADCVFGLLYVQCEDDFKRVEANYIDKLGRWAEIKGESSLYEDLFIRLVIDSAEAVADFKKTPPAFQKLLSAYADGVNYFLFTHPEVHPQLLTRFKPWYALLWTDGSISAINSADIKEADVKNFIMCRNLLHQTTWKKII
jgi:acyl-homoserine lactone acylase PvdQ